MATSKLLGLPPITPELKSIVPYLQRADEMKTQDPVIAYWCAYYAAQVGISVKAKDTASRDVLFALLGTLERMKKGIGNNDAIDNEAVGAAHVENFALRVFVNADNEDRKGNATRATARKFMAAANFLDVLKTFPKSELTESHDERVRYAKWKAADIAKAFREGRKPTPGPSGSGIDPELQPPTNISTSTVAPSSPLPNTRPPPRGSRSPPVRHSPPPVIDQNDAIHSYQYSRRPQTPPQQINMGDGDITPGGWSTAATPGTTSRTTHAYFDPNHLLPQGTDSHPPDGNQKDRSHRQRKKRRSKSRSGSSSSGSGGSPTGRGEKKKKAWVSEELENPRPSPPPRPPLQTGDSFSRAAGESKKTVHFTPSVVGGLSSAEPSPVVSSAYATVGDCEGSSFLGSTVGIPPPFTPPPLHHPAEIPGTTQGTPFGPQIPGNPQPYGVVSTLDQVPHAGSSFNPPGMNPIDPATHGVVTSPSLPPPSVSPLSPPPTHFAPPAPPPPPVSYLPPARTPSPRAVELTIGIVAKAQKHCRFAISALDYEDAEQARKELRAALALLGG